MNELALFAGAGGGLLASKLLGWNTVGAVEIEEYPRNVLLQRQRDGILEPFPIWDDVCTFDGRPWRGLVDVISGGFPCQDISVAGKGAGLAGSRSGLWFDYLRIIAEVRPSFVFAENSPLLRKRGLGTIIQGLAELGYDTRWCVLGAWHIGATHKRDRMWVFAFDPDQVYAFRGEFSRQPCVPTTEWQTTEAKQERYGWFTKLEPANALVRFSSYSDAVRTLHGMAYRLDRTDALGNGQVPAVAATAFRILSEGVL